MPDYKGFNTVETLVVFYRVYSWSTTVQSSTGYLMDIWNTIYEFCSNDWWYAMGQEFCWVYRCPDEEQWLIFMAEKCFWWSKKDAYRKKFPINVRALFFAMLELLRYHVGEMKSTKMNQHIDLVLLWLQMTQNMLLMSFYKVQNATVIVSNSQSKCLLIIWQSPISG